MPDWIPSRDDLPGPAVFDDLPELPPWRETAIRSYVTATACQAIRQSDLTREQRLSVLQAMQAEQLPVLAVDLGL